MRVLPALYKELAEKDGRYPLLKLELYDESGNVVKTVTGSDSVIRASIVNGQTTTPNRFDTGIAFCAELTAELSDSCYDFLHNSREINVYSGFKNGVTAEKQWIKVGVFFGEDVKRNNSGTVNLKARDRMMYAEKVFDGEGLTYPCTLTELYQAVCKEIGAPIDPDYILHVNVTVYEYPIRKTGGMFISAGGKKYDGRPYTCRQIIAQIAKMQLGNAFCDGDGYIKFYSYENASERNDNNVTAITLSKDYYRTNVLIYQSNTATGEVEYIKDEDIYGTIVYNTFIKSDNVDSGTPGEQIDAQLQKIKAIRFFGGEISYKGTGEAEIGDVIHYSGKMGDKVLFVNGIMAEWQNGSYDETVYSFAPTYESSAFSSENTDKATSDVAAASEDNSSNPDKPTISNAVFLKEEQAKYILHKYGYVEYDAGVKAVYSTVGASIIVNGATFYKNTGLVANKTTLEEAFPDGVPICYQSGEIIRLPDSSYDITQKYVRIWRLTAPTYTASTNLYEQCLEYSDDGGETWYREREYTVKSYGEPCIGVAFVYNTITQEYVTAEACYIGRNADGFWTVNRLYRLLSYGGTGGNVYFKDITEYQAAVALKFEPNVETSVEVANSEFPKTNEQLTEDIADIQIGYDGQAYGSAGEAVRGQMLQGNAALEAHATDRNIHHTTEEIKQIAAMKIVVGDGLVGNQSGDTFVIEISSPEQHRMVFGGRNLGTEVTSSQLAAIRDGSFNGLLVGDYWVMGGVNWRIADMDYWLHCGDKAFEKHHLVILPDKSLYNANMNDKNTTTGGYVGSKMYTENLEQAKTTINSLFVDMVLTHREYLVNAVANGKASGGAWLDSTVELMNENMVYGHREFTPGCDGTTVPANYTIDKTQLALFQIAPKFVVNRAHWWLRDVVSAAFFARITPNGEASFVYATGSLGVRPVFAIG